MFLFLYGIICLGALGITFISVIDNRIVNKLPVRIVTVVILGVSWYEPLTFVTRQFEMQSGFPQWLGIGIVLLLMAPFFWTTITIFTGGDPIAEKFQQAMALRFTQSADSFPDAEKAEAAKDWDRAFAIYRDKYLPKQFNNPMLWRRLLGIVRRWNDPEKTASELLTMVRGAPDDDKRVEYALGAADLLSIGIGSSGRATQLLKATLPVFKTDAQRDRVTAKINALAASEATTLRAPAARTRTPPPNPPVSE
jgi:hypothetical protein